MEAKTRLWIDARHEKPLSSCQAIEYILPELNEEKTQQALVKSLFPFIKELSLLDRSQYKVKITYDPNTISQGFIEYLFKQNNVLYKRINS